MSTQTEDTNSSNNTSVQQTENDVAKYKRVLSLARSSLEASQANLAVKDQQINQLIKALEEEKKKNKNKTIINKDDESTFIPRKILSRVDIEDIIWILIEYDDNDDTWKSFDNEQELLDFIQRIPGVPLVVPSKCLSVEESHRILEDSNRRIERIVEEFRRFKVRTEIARKQKDAENRQSILNGTTLTNTTNTILSTNLIKENILDNNSYSSNNNNNDTTIHEEIQKLKQSFKEQETQWKLSFDKIMKENEILRSKGGESLLATQWRNRYESCLKEKEDLAEKVKGLTYSANYNNNNSSRPTTSLTSTWDTSYRSHTASGSIAGTNNIPLDDNTDDYYSGDSISSKIQYVRHMVFQYLSCRDTEVKAHIETALMAIFRMNEAEREAIEALRREETQDALSSITDFFGSLSSTLVTSSTTNIIN